jgi:hypothetical protein
VASNEVKPKAKPETGAGSMSKWPNGARPIEQIADNVKGQVLSSRRISSALKDWCAKHPDLEPSKVHIWIRAFSTDDDKPDDATFSDDVLTEWLNPRALTDGACYFALSDELEGYPIKLVRLFRKGKQYAVLFELLDYVPWNDSVEDE